MFADRQIPSRAPRAANGFACEGVKVRVSRLVAPLILCSIVSAIGSGCCEWFPSLCPDRNVGELKSTITLHRAGGLVGLDERISVAATGLLTITGGPNGADSRQLSSAERGRVAELAADWDSYQLISHAAPCADTFTDTISYDGGAKSWDDCSDVVSAGLTQLRDYLLEIAE